MQTTLLRSTLAIALLSSAVPATAQNREHQQMSAEMRMLQEQTQQLALTLAQLADALKAINARMDAADQAARQRFADQEQLIKALGSDLSAIRERTQDTDTRLRKLGDEVEALRTTMTSLPSMLSAAAMVSTNRRIRTVACAVSIVAPVLAGVCWADSSRAAIATASAALRIECVMRRF